MNEGSSDHSNGKAGSGYSRYRNGARRAPLAVRSHPLKYTSPLDTKNLMTADQFRQSKMRNSSNRYIHDDATEIPTPTSTSSPQTATSTTGRSETILSGTTARTSTSISRGTNREIEDFAPHGWYVTYNGSTNAKW